MPDIFIPGLAGNKQTCSLTRQLSQHITDYINIYNKKQIL
ncbi:IS3 family transposase [Chitinophaga sp. RAB17]